jgi:hypothetical protein
MNLKSNQNEKIFYSYEWDTILNSLLNFLPTDNPFNLYEISQQVGKEYSDFLANGLAKNEKTYIDITNSLIYNGFVKLSDFHNITLTEKGRQLVEYGSFKKYAQIAELRKKAEIRELWIKKNWFWVEFVKICIGIILGAMMTLGIQQLSLCII